MTARIATAALYATLATIALACVPTDTWPIITAAIMHALWGDNGVGFWVVGVAGVAAYWVLRERGVRS